MNEEKFLKELRKRADEMTGQPYGLLGRPATREQAIDAAMEQASAELSMQNYAATIASLGGEEKIFKLLS